MNRLPLTRALVVILLVIASAGAMPNAGGVEANPSGDTCRDPTQDIPTGRGVSVAAPAAAVNATVSRINDTTIRFTYHDLNPDEADFGPSLTQPLRELGLRATSTNGFRILTDNHGTSLWWNNSVDTPSITFTTDIQRGGNGFEDAGAAIQPQWAFIPLPQHSLPTNISMAEGHEGVVGDQVLLLGEYSLYRRTVGCHTIELYIPDAVETAESPTEIANSLQSTARHLSVGWRYDTVRVFGVGNPIRLGGRAFTHEVWVHVDSTFEPEQPRGIRDPPRLVLGNVWIHEYVHTRQRWGLNRPVSSDALWLREALASYYMIAETERQGRMLANNETRYWMRLNRSLRFGDQRMKLTEPSSYQRQRGAYTRGAYVLAALDEKIRSETGGSKSLVDVFYRLNHQKEVTHSSFRRAVIAVGGDELGPWVDRYVAGTAVPEAPGPTLEDYLELIPQRRDYQQAVVLGVLLFLCIIIAIVYRFRSWN